MPTIEVPLSDLESLLNEKLDPSHLTALLSLVKGEIKEWTTDLLKIELNDTNRPDLWSPEGVARQIRIHAGKETIAQNRYRFFTERARHTIHVSEAVATVRPYLGGFIVHGITVTESLLTQLIQSQEKLSEIFGQKRHSLSIGLYRLGGVEPIQKVVFPVRYDLADPNLTQFTPLGYDQPVSLNEILQSHPKGIAYREILKGQTRYPILIDANNQILSFPPIINSRGIGEVKVGDTDLLVEVTGCNLKMVILAANIFACNLADRGGLIEPLTISYPQKTDFGRDVKMPYDLSNGNAVDLPAREFERALGETLTVNQIKSCLLSYGYRVTQKGKTLRCTLPPYRNDLMHPIDIVEDFAMSRGYQTFTPTMPSTATIGLRSPVARRSDRLAETMVGFGFEEVISNVLSSYPEQVDWMRIHASANRPEGRVVAIENPITERYAIPRSWILPSLLRVEGASSKAYYPHRIFEIGEIAHMMLSGNQSETELHFAAMISYAEARFSDLHAVLTALLHALGIACRLAPITHPTFIEGRAGAILVEGQEIGFIGEIHPEVLTQWEISVPCVAFEIKAVCGRPIPT